MVYQIFNFSNASLLPVAWDTRQEADAVCDWDKQCVVTVAETLEDHVWMGDDPNCDHALHPNDCTYCNPAWRRVMELENGLRGLLRLSMFDNHLTTKRYINGLLDR
jgi:hypothetical protein